MFDVGEQQAQKLLHCNCILVIILDNFGHKAYILLSKQSNRSLCYVLVNT